MAALRVVCLRWKLGAGIVSLIVWLRFGTDDERMLCAPPPGCA